MRILYFLFLIVFAGSVGIFAYQNQQEITLQFLQWSAATNVAIVVGVTYLLGMLSGWTVVGMIRVDRSDTVADQMDRRPKTP